MDESFTRLQLVVSNVPHDGSEERVISSCGSHLTSATSPRGLLKRTPVLNSSYLCKGKKQTIFAKSNNSGWNRNAKVDRFTNSRGNKEVNKKQNND